LFKLRKHQLNQFVTAQLSQIIPGHSDPILSNLLQFA
jgi:hypothetical protein